MSMTAAEARSELKKLYTEADEIEKKYPDGLTEAANAEDHRQVKALLQQCDGLEAQLTTLDDAEQRKARVGRWLGDLSTPNRPAFAQPGAELARARQLAMTPGTAFVDSPEYKAHQDRGLFNSATGRIEFTAPMPEGSSLLSWAKRTLSPEQKALVWGGTGVGGPLVLPDYQPGITQILQRPIVVTDLVPHLTTNSETISYVVEQSFVNAAAPVAEATATTGTSGTKPETTLTFATQTAAVRTIAHWIPVTNRMLADAAAIRGYIDTRLMVGLEQALETQVLTGDGTGENLLGILNTPNIQTTAATTAVLDGIWNARTLVQVNGLGNPNAVVIHPTNFSAVRLAKETTGGYLMGPPSQVGPVTIWGLPVYTSLFLTPGTILVGDFQQASTLFDREQGQVRAGWINDQFTRNIQTILAELRAAFVTYRPQMYCRVTGAP